MCTLPFPIDWEEPKQYFLEWFDYLQSKKFGFEDPIFPATLCRLNDGEISYSSKILSNNFWSSAGSARKIFEKRCNNSNLQYFHPHSFRHLIVNLIAKAKLTEEQKKAISLNLGHENVSTTFGSYGYGGMSSEDATKIVQNICLSDDRDQTSRPLSEDERSFLEGILKRK